MKQRSFLLLLLLLSVCVAPTYAAGTGASALPDHVTLTWTGDPAKTITITWRTDTTVNTGLVQYTTDTTFTRTPKAVAAIPRDFTTDLGTTRLFTVTLNSLTAKRQYMYRVGDGVQWSDPHTFTTADPRARPFKFLVFGDSQSDANGQAPYALWHTTVHNAYQANPDARFMVNVGDLVDLGLNGAHWNAWFTAAAGVVDTIPVMPVVGNHELYPGPPKPTFWLAQFSLPQNGPAGVKGQAYSYTYGSVHCVVLDSQLDEQQAAGDIAKPQQAWLEADLAASKATWNIVFFHKPPYGVWGGRTNQSVKAAFCPTMEQHHVDLVFNAHDHGVARTYPIKDGVYQQKPSQGTIYYISGRSGQKSYPFVTQQAWDTFFYNPLDQPNYFVIEVADTTLTVKTVKQDGTVVDTFVIDKAKDISSDTAPSQHAPVASPAAVPASPK